ncbi:MAG: DUF983 domain-containing protein [Alphaproteobacteria bacterium]
MSLSRVLGAMKRGAAFRCPQCGKGNLFRKYLKVQETCPICGHDNAQYPADDGPAYFTILIAGHLFVAPLFLAPFILKWPLLWVASVLAPSVMIIALFLLPRVKGAVIGLMWAIREVEGRVPGQEESELF